MPWLVWAQLFDGFVILFSLGFFTILCAFEDNRSFMGGSDVVHCVRMSLTGTTIVPFWAHWSMVGIGLYNYTLFVTLLVGMGPL